MTRTLNARQLRHIRGAHRWLVLGAILCLGNPAAPAWANEPCQAGAGVVITGAPALAFHEAYNPFAATGIAETISITVANYSPATCDLSLIVTAENGEGTLHHGGGSLTYAVETSDGTPLLRPNSTTNPQAGAHIPFSLAPGQSAAITLHGRVLAQQTATPGSYADNAARLRVYRRPENGDFGALLAEKGFPVSADVAGVCIMSAPEPASIDFSDDIGSDGRPAGAARTIQLPEAACNTGARVKLSGAPLVHQAGAELTGFDSFIGFEAEANFGSVSALLATTQAGQTNDAASPATPAAASGPVDVTIRLLAGRPLAAGSYSSVVTIMLEPSP